MADQSRKSLTGALMPLTSSFSARLSFLVSMTPWLIISLLTHLRSRAEGPPINFGKWPGSVCNFTGGSVLSFTANYCPNTRGRNR
jgi:hypothetical protein